YGPRIGAPPAGRPTSGRSTPRHGFRLARGLKRPGHVSGERRGVQRRGFGAGRSGAGDRAAARADVRVRAGGAEQRRVGRAAARGRAGRAAGAGAAAAARWARGADAGPAARAGGGAGDRRGLGDGGVRRGRAGAADRSAPAPGRLGRARLRRRPPVRPRPPARPLLLDPETGAEQKLDEGVVATSLVTWGLWEDGLFLYSVADGDRSGVYLAKVPGSTGRRWCPGRGAA